MMQIWLGGNHKQTSLARSFMDRVKLLDLEKVLEPLFYYWKQKRQSKESFGDFTNRMVSFTAYFLFACNPHLLTLVLIFKMIIMVVKVIGKFGLSYSIFCFQGFEKLKEYIEKWEGPVVAPSRHNLKLFADKETYESMDALAKLQNKTAHQLAMEVIRNYVASNQNGKGE